MNSPNTQPAARTVIAIDGGAASGKSTAARATAKALGFLHVDSGALYRAISWRALADRLDPTDTAAIKSLVSRLDFTVEAANGGVRIRIRGNEPREADIRSPETTKTVSPISAIAEVRALVNAQLRKLAQTCDCVVEGRDIGTVVFPNAAHKFYLVASPEERARRRKLDFEKLSQQPASKTDAQHAAELERTKRELAERDRRDSSRAADPLRAAQDAVVIDTTHHTVEQTAAEILQHIRQHPSAAKTA